MSEGSNVLIVPTKHQLFGNNYANTLIIDTSSYDFIDAGCFCF